MYYLLISKTELCSTPCELSGYLNLSASWRYYIGVFFFFSSRRRHTRFDCDWSSDVCSSDLNLPQSINFASRVGGRQYAQGGQNVTEAYECDFVYYPNHDYLLCAAARGGNVQKIGRASCRERV